MRNFETFEKSGKSKNMSKREAKDKNRPSLLRQK